MPFYRCRRALLHKMISDGFWRARRRSTTPASSTTKPYDIDTSGAAVRGDPKAPITIVEFSDFEVPHCRMAEPWLKQIISENPT